MIICTIDGASFFESEYHRAGMDSVMRYFGSLLRAVSSAGNRSLVFKQLATSPTVVENGGSWFPDAVRLDVPVGGELLSGVERLEPGSRVLLGRGELRHRWLMGGSLEVGWGWGLGLVRLG